MSGFVNYPDAVIASLTYFTLATAFICFARFSSKSSFFGFIGFLGIFPVTFGFLILIGEASQFNIPDPSAALFSFSGLVIIFTSLRSVYLNPKFSYRLIPMAVTMISITGFILLWQFQYKREQKYQVLRIEDEVERVKLEINETLKQTSQALMRFAARVEYLGVKDISYLNFDSHLYLQQLPILNRIGLIDHDYKVFWSYPKEISEQVSGFDQSADPVRFEAIHEAIMLRQPSLSQSIQLRSGGLGFLIPVALYPKGHFTGLLYATVEARRLFHSFAPTSNFQISILEYNKIIFQSNYSGTLAPNWIQKQILQLGHRKWQIEIIPTEKYLSDGHSLLPNFILLFGIFISLLLGALLQNIFNSRKHILISADDTRILSLRLRNALQVAKLGTWEREYIPGGKITFIDDQAKTIFGFEVQNSNPNYSEVMAKVFAEDKVLIAKKLSSHFEDETRGFEVKFRLMRDEKTQKISWIHARGQIVRQPDAVPLLVSTVQDVTEEVETRQQLHLALQSAEEATRAKSDFLANMSHEIRTPLNGVIGMNNLLLSTDLNPTQKAYAEMVYTSANILLVLIKDILDFSKIEARKLDMENIDFDLEKLIKNTVQLSQLSVGKKKVAVHLNFADELVGQICKGDPNRIGQILANLMSNAMKFTAEGKISVSVFQESHGIVKFNVIDSGIGMTSAVVSRLFQPFNQADASTTRKFGGTGLGLSISKHLVELMGGKIGVQSQPGVGSTFWFSLPLEQGTFVVQNNDRSRTQQSKTVLTENIRILVAEDNKINQIIAVSMLETLGYQVDVVSNGVEAIDAFTNQVYDLILMDCQMPELDGYETTRRIRHDFPDFKAQIPIIAMTANAMAGDREACLRAGMDNYVTKPIDVLELESVILNTLAQKNKKSA